MEEALQVLANSQSQSAIVVKEGKPVGSISLDKMIAAIARPAQGPAPEQRYR